MTLITFLSTLVILLGFISILPQLSCMAQSRNSAGQSVLGWLVGGLVNAIMIYVNFFGYHASALALGSTTNLLLCGVALFLVVRFRHGGRVEDLPLAPAVEPLHQISELPTSEFWALQASFDEEASRRAARRAEQTCPA